MEVSVAGSITKNAIATVAATLGNEPSIPVVIFTGLVLVFGILIILYLVLLLQGRIFSSLDKKKQEQKEVEKVAAAQAAVPAPVEACAPAAAAVPASAPVYEGVSPEVVAAISAAVTEFSAGQYSVQNISGAQSVQSEPIPTKTERRGRWGLAGVMSDTEPF